MKTKTHLPMHTPFGVEEFAADITSAVDLQTYELSVSINFLGSDNTYIAVIKTTPQNAWNLANLQNRNVRVYDEITSHPENWKKFEAWFAENVVNDLIQECERCCGDGCIVIGETRFDDGRGGYDFAGGEDIDCPRCEGTKYELIN
jgi:Tat protein secretion system quality control protein TatD with DNase activity